MMKKLVYAVIAILFLALGACQEATNSNTNENKTQEEKQTSIGDANKQTSEIATNEEEKNKAETTEGALLEVSADGMIRMNADPQSDDYRIFGYEKADSKSKRLWILSVFTKDVENNPLGCELGAYYDLDNMADNGMRFKKYLGTEGDFAKIELTREGKSHIIYIAKSWVAVE